MRMNPAPVRTAPMVMIQRGARRSRRLPERMPPAAYMKRFSEAPRDRRAMVQPYSLNMGFMKTPKQYRDP